MNVRTHDCPHHRHNPRIKEGEAYVEYSHLGVLANRVQHVEAMVCFLAAGNTAPATTKEFYNATKDSLRRWGLEGMEARAKKNAQKFGQQAGAVVDKFIK